jgi:hypothetical protein
MCRRTANDAARRGDGRSAQAATARRLFRAALRSLALWCGPLLADIVAWAPARHGGSVGARMGLWALRAAGCTMISRIWQAWTPQEGTFPLSMPICRVGTIKVEHFHSWSKPEAIRVASLQGKRWGVSRKDRDS